MLQANKSNFARPEMTRTKLLMGGVSVAAILVVAPIAVVPTYDATSGVSTGWTVSLSKQALAQVNLTGASNNTSQTGATNPVAFTTEGTQTLGNGTAASIVANGTNVALNINGTTGQNVTITNLYNITAANASAIALSAPNATLSINSTITNNGTGGATIAVTGNQSAGVGITLGSAANVSNSNTSGFAFSYVPAAALENAVLNTSGTIGGNINMASANLTLNASGGNITGNITTNLTNNTVGVVNLSGNVTITGNVGANGERLLHFNQTNATNNVATVNGSIFVNNSTINGTLNLTGTANVTTNLTIGVNGNITLGGNITAGNIAAASGGNGSLRLNATQTIIATDIGVSGTRLGLIAVGSSGVVTLNTTNTSVTAINLAANASLTQNFAATGLYNVNTTTLLANSTLIITGAAGTINGSVAGSTGTGELRINSGNATTLGAASSVGNNASTGLATVNVANGTLNTLANNANITATRIIVGASGVLAANGTGTLNATTLNVAGTANISNATLTSGINFLGAGTVNANNTINASLGAVATNVTNTGTLNISNGGTVTVSTIGASGLVLANLNFTEAGTTNVSGAIFSTNINVAGGHTVNAAGAITGATNFGSNATLNLSANHTGAITTATNGTGTLRISGNSTTSTHIGAAGTELLLLNVSSGTFNPGGNISALTVNLASGTTTNISSNATILASTAFTSAGNLNIRGATVTLNVAATANGLASTGVLTFIPTSTTNNQTGLVANTALTANTSFRVAVDMSQVTLASGSSLVINTTNINMTGALVNFTTANTSFLTFTRNGANITITTVSGGYTTAIAGATSTPGSASLGAALNSASSSAPAGSDVATILQRVQTLSGTALAAAVESLKPDQTGGGAAAAASQSAGTAVAGPVTSRTNAVRTANAGGETAETGFSAGIGGRPTGAWFQAFGSLANKSAQSGFVGYDGRTLGAAAGLDSQITDKFLLGVFGSFSASDSTPKNIDGSRTDIDSYSGGLYTNYDISNQWYLEGLAAYTRHGYESKRSTAAAGGGNVTGSWHGNQLTGRVGSGYSVTVNPNWTVTPNGFLQYTTLRQDDYSESGVGALRVTQKNLNSTTAGVGGRFTGNYALQGGYRLLPEARLGIQQDFGSSTPSSTNSFVTTPASTFTVDGKELSKTAFTYGAGATLRLTGGLDLSGNYDGEKRTAFISHTFVARLRQNF